MLKKTVERAADLLLRVMNGEPPLAEEPPVRRPRPSKTRSPEVRYLIHDAAQCQRLGEVVAAALRVNELVTLCPQDEALAEWLVYLRRAIDAQHEQDRALREEKCATLVLPGAAVSRIVELARGRARDLECSLDELDELAASGDSFDAESFEALGLENSLRGRLVA